MQQLLITTFLFITIFSHSQNNNPDCEGNLQKEPYITRIERYDPTDEGLLTDYKILADCGDLDSIDEVIFLGENLVLVVIEMDQELTKPTYRDLLHEIHRLQKDEYFMSLRQDLLDKLSTPDSGTGTNEIFQEESKIDKLKQEPYIIQMATYDPNDKRLLEDYRVLAEYGQLDSIDQELFLGPNLLNIVMNLDAEMPRVTYNDILNEIHMRQTLDSYIPERERIAARLSIQNKVVNLNTFSSDSLILIKTGFIPSELADFLIFLKQNNTKTWTYKEAVFLFADQQRKLQQEAAQSFDFDELVDFEKALATAKKSNRKCLIYFSGYANANARKMENRMFSDPAIVDLVKNNFVYYIAYTDDKQKTADGQSTVGERNEKLELEKFKSYHTPQFYILDGDGKIIAQQPYSLDRDSFIAFLSSK